MINNIANKEITTEGVAQKHEVRQQANAPDDGMGPGMADADK